MILLKSKLYRDEIKHWALFGVLIIWGSFASVFALKNNEKTYLIGIDESGARIITDSNDRILQNELKSFLKSFIDLYYSYDEKTFASQIEKASDLMTQSLWEQKKEALLELKEKLQRVPLTQSAEIQSIDLVGESKIEGILLLSIKTKINEHKIKLKVNLSFQKNLRSERNPWGFEITEVSDVAL